MSASRSPWEPLWRRIYKNSAAMAQKGSRTGYTGTALNFVPVTLVSR